MSHHALISEESLPKEVAWPEREGRRLGFLARLSLVELHAAHPVEWLPKSGALLFLYDLEDQPWGFDPKDRGSWAVISVPDLDSPMRGSAESPREELADALPCRNVEFRSTESLPSLERESVEALGLSDEEEDAYDRLRDEPFLGMPRHQVGGYPTPVQDDGMELECQLASHGIYCGDPSGYRDPRAAVLGQTANAWRLLLQFDSDDGVDVMWGDEGMVYFWIREEDARARNFEGSWLVLQCH